MRKVVMLVVLALLMGLMPLTAIAGEAPSAEGSPVVAIPAGGVVEVAAESRVKRPPPPIPTTKTYLGTPSGKSYGQAVWAPIPCSGDACTEFTVEFGWYIYVYLNASDWAWLAGLGLTAASFYICAALGLAAGIGGLACAVGSFIAGMLFVPGSAPPPGYCKQVVFTYLGTFVWSVNVWRSC